MPSRFENPLASFDFNTIDGGQELGPDEILDPDGTETPPDDTDGDGDGGAPEPEVIPDDEPDSGGEPDPEPEVIPDDEPDSGGEPDPDDEDDFGIQVIE